MNTNLSVEEKARILDSVGDRGSLTREVDDWYICDRKYWNSKSVIGNDYTKKMLKGFREEVMDYRNGDLVSIKALHKLMIEAMYDRRLSEEQIDIFREIIMEAKGCNEDDYEDFTKEDEEDD